MNKLRGQLILFITVMIMMTTYAYADGISVVVDGEKIVFDTEPVIINDRTMVPMRAVFEALGSDVSWEDATKTATAKKDDITLSITIDDDVMYKNGAEIKLDSPAVLINSRTLVPVRAISEAFGCSVSWNSDTQTVLVVTGGGVQITSVYDIPQYTGDPYIVVNGNKAYFDESELTAEPFEIYSDLDELGRCGTAYANICIELMPTDKRGSISSVKPTGWHSVTYDFISGKYLYNRCHLIGRQLAGENANKKNLITGTRYLNVDGMLPFEDEVAEYVKKTDHHVLYRVTPYFGVFDLVAKGVLMEAESVEDGGVSFNVFCYNVQPGVVIDYLTGESYAE